MVMLIPTEDLRSALCKAEDTMRPPAREFATVFVLRSARIKATIGSRHNPH